MPTSLGMRANVDAGAFDPAGVCQDTGALGCGTNGKCDGFSACQSYGGGPLCAAASCPAGASTLTSDRFCDGAGHCAPGTGTGCGNYKCNGAAACLVSCID